MKYFGISNYQLCTGCQSDFLKCSWHICSRWFRFHTFGPQFSNSDTDYKWHCDQDFDWTAIKRITFLLVNLSKEALDGNHFPSV